LLSDRIRSDPITNIHGILVKAKKFKRAGMDRYDDEATSVCSLPSQTRWNEIERQQLEKPRSNFIEGEGVA
jgi:hypothetical protein